MAPKPGKPASSAVSRPAWRSISWPAVLIVGLIAVLFSRSSTLLAIPDEYAQAIDELAAQLPEGIARSAAQDALLSLRSMAETRPAPTRADSVGQRSAAAGMRARHPVVLLPGFITSGLELWQGDECARPFFRQRWWGTASMVKLLTLQPQCWLRHMQLDAATGTDLPGIALRPTAGFGAADYFYGGFWVWAKLIQALSEIGYTPSNMHMASYDWRLPYAQLEARDRFFSGLTAHIETVTAPPNPAKAVVIAHSMGTVLWTYYAQWVVLPSGGNRAASWIEDHVHAVALLGGPLLGAHSALGGIVLGECSDFALLTGSAGRQLNAVVSPAKRRSLFRSWGAGQTLLPKGGDAVWGGHGPAFQRRRGAADGAAGGDNKELVPVLTLDETMAMLERDAEASQGRWSWWYDHGAIVGRNESERAALRAPPERAWANPLLGALPPAPSTTYYCLNGVGKPTDVGYVVSEDLVREQPPEPLGEGEAVPFLLDRDAAAHGVKRATVFADGDGTVALESMGYMCEGPWARRGSPHNPSGVPVVLREYENKKGRADDPLDTMRGVSAESAGHVDMLGNEELLADLIAIASGRTDAHPVERRVLSGITELTREIDERLGMVPPAA